jgi:hypothetical protein
MAKKRIVATGGWSSSNSKPKSKPKTKVKKPSIFEKAKNITKSYISKGFDGKRADDMVVEVRNMSCNGLGDIGLPPCEYRGDSKVEEGRNYCLECGCGDRQSTWLNRKEKDEYIKLDFPNVVCPLQMPGFTNFTKSELESEDRIDEYNGFERKKKIEGYCETMGVDIVELSVVQDVKNDGSFETI